MNCWHCQTELIWGSDSDLDEELFPEFSFVTNLSCPKCESFVEVFYPRNENVNEHRKIKKPSEI
mgnify:CR=1 FL=1|tara:strand:+ start:1398 stop:1589 length:192 start_codon:yes stop_codon:yes gene_type:complete